MANTDAPFGLRPLRNVHGAPYSGSGRKMVGDSGYSTALFIGDPVVITGGADANGIPQVNLANAAGPVSGVIVGIAPDPDNLTLQYRAADTTRILYVETDPDVVYAIQDDGAGTPAAGNVGANANLVFTHAGSTVTGRSGAELDGSTYATTAGHALQIVDLYQVEGNDITADYAIWEVRLNDHQQSATTAGI